MSIFYSIDVTLDLQYTEENIKSVLSRGACEGFIYFEDFLPSLESAASIELIAYRILYMDPVSGERRASTKFQDTNFAIHFFKADDNLLIFSMGNFGYRWDRESSYGSRVCTIDFARYIRLMLQVCEDMSFLELVTLSDEMENLAGTNRNCVRAAISISPFEGKYLGDIETAKESIQGFLYNASQNGFVFFDEASGEITVPSVQRYYDTLKAEFPVNLYAKVDGVAFKIEIKKNERTYDFVSIYPLEPYRMKKGYGSEEEKIDLVFYIKRLIELCENFAIYKLKTFL